MATIVLQVPDETLVAKVKQACKMLRGVASVNVLKEPKKEQRLYDSETGKYMKKERVKEIEDAMKGIGVKTCDSVDDMFKQILGYVPGKAH